MARTLLHKPHFGYLEVPSIAHAPPGTPTIAPTHTSVPARSHLAARHPAHFRRQWRGARSGGGSSARPSERLARIRGEAANTSPTGVFCAPKRLRLLGDDSRGGGLGLVLRQLHVQNALVLLLLVRAR